MRSIAFIIWALLLAGPVFSQRLEYYTTLDWGDGGGVTAPIALRSGRVIMPLGRTSVYRSGSQACQIVSYQNGVPIGYANRMLAVINPDGDTSHTVSRPFHFKELMGGIQVGDKLHSLVSGPEPDSCWAGDTWWPPAGIRTLDSNGNVLDSISFIDYWPGKRYFFNWPVYDRYGVTTICIDVDDFSYHIGRFSYSGQLRYFHPLPNFPNSAGLAGPLYADVDGGYYAQLVSRNMNAIARLDSSGNLRYFKELPPDYPASNLHQRQTCLTADGGVAYAYQNGYFNNDSVNVIALDRYENRRYRYKFRGDIKEMVPLADNSLLVFRTFRWDSTSSNRTYVHEVVRIDSLGNVTWRQQLLPRSGSWPAIISSVFTHIYGDGSCFFNFVAGNYPITYPVYGHISGVARYDPDAIKKKGPLHGLSLYPNPASGTVQVAGLARRQMGQLLSLEGKEVKALELIPGQPVSVADLSPGLYLLKLEDGRVARLAVQR